MSISVTIHQNKYLSEGTGEVHAVISVASTGGTPAVTPADKAVVLVVDVSGSMESPSTKISAARKAAATAIEMLPDGTLFALVAGDHQARCAYPQSGEGLVRADATTRTDAIEVARRLYTSGGGTAISTWIDLARNLVEPYDDAVRIGYLLTDGKNEHETSADLEAAVARATGVLQCDARGVGADWSVTELRTIASALLGEVDIIKRPEEMEDDFATFMARAIGKTLPDIRLRVWRPTDAKVRFLRQVAPSIQDLTDAVIPVDAHTSDHRTGAWSGEETRDYHLCVDLPSAEVGVEKLVARVSVVLGDGVASQGLVLAEWTDDLDRSTQRNERVYSYVGQEEGAAAIQEGLLALEEGDIPTATLKFRRAVELATAAGDEARLKLLRGVVDIDERDGTVKVKRTIDKIAEMDLDLGSTRTVRVHKSDGPPSGGEGEEVGGEEQKEEEQKEEEQ